jgi:hypothetical protein
MIPTQIVTGLAMGGSVTHDTLRALAIIIPMLKAGFVPLTSIVIYPAKQSPISCPILLIRFDSYASLVLKKEFPTLFSTGLSTQPSLDLSKENTQGQTNTQSTLISRLRKRLTMTGLFFKYLC